MKPRGPVFVKPPMAGLPSNWPLPAAALVVLLVLAACAPARPPHYTVFALAGPPLAIAGGRLNDSGAASLSGRMDRSCMVGNGEIELAYPPASLNCRGRLQAGPAENGRVRGIIPCADPGGSEGQALFLLLTLGQQGPDQGVGVARLARGRAALAGPAVPPAAAGPTLIEDLEISEEPPLLFFYHPWDEEAGRRYQEARVNVLRALENKKPGTATNITNNL